MYVVFTFLCIGLCNRSKISALGQKKLPLFPEIRMTGKIFTWTAANLFIFIDFSEIFSFLFKFLLLFCILVSFCLFIWCFLKLKMCIMIHNQLWGRLSDKKFFTRPISGNKTIFFLPYFCYVDNARRPRFLQIIVFSFYLSIRLLLFL